MTADLEFPMERKKTETQSCVKNPYTNGKFQKAKWKHKTPPKRHLQNDCGPTGRSIWVTPAIELVWLNQFTGYQPSTWRWNNYKWTDISKNEFSVHVKYIRMDWKEFAVAHAFEFHGGHTWSFWNQTLDQIHAMNRCLLAEYAIAHV